MQKGFVVTYLLFGVLVLAALGGAYYFSQTLNLNKSLQYPLGVAEPDAKKLNEQSKKIITEKNNIDETAIWKTYTDNKNGFSLQYPQGWVAEIPKGKEEPASFNLTSSLTVIRVIISPTDKNLDEWLNNIKTGESIEKITEKSRRIINSVTAEKEVTEYQGSGQVTVVMVNKGKVYQIIATFKDNKAEVLQIFDQILSTFKFIP